MKWSLIILAMLLACPASAELQSYSVSGSIDTITPGTASGSGLPSGFDVGEEFLLEISIDTNQPLVDLAPHPSTTTYEMQASIALHVGSASLIEPSRSVFVTTNCAFVIACTFSIERTVASGPIVPFDDSSIGQVGFMAAFADESGATGLGAPLVPNGQEASFFITTCIPPTGCLIDYTAIGTVSSIQSIASVPALGPIGLVCLGASIVVGSRVVWRPRGRRSGG